MGKLARIFSAVILALSSALAAVTILNSNSYAASGDFAVETVEVESKSDGVEAEISKIDDSTIRSETRFNKLNDSAEFKLTLKNVTGYKLTINSISVANENEYIELSYDDYMGTELAAGDSFDFVLRAVYANAIADSSARSQSLDAKISITYTDERGNEGTAEITVSPNTGDNILAIIGIFAASALALLAIILFTRRKLAHGKLFGVIASIATLGILLPSVASANDGLGEIQFTSDFEIYSKIHVKVNDGIEDHEGDIDYGTSLGDILDDADVPGYIFNGWKNEDGSDFDPNTPVYDDINIHPDLTPISYTIAIDTDDDGNADTTIDVTYDQNATLPTNNQATKPGHTPNGWTDGTAHYADNETVSNLTTENNGTVNLRPDFEPNHFVVEIDTDGDDTIDTTLNVTYGEEALLPANTAEKSGYTPNGWTDGTNHYDDGTNLGALPLDNGDEITLSPAWTRNTYIITIDPGEGTLPGDNEISGYYGDEVDLPTPTAPTGKKFTGWYDDEDNKLDSAITITDTTTVYAHYRDIATEAEWYNGSLNNMYMKELNANATTFKRYATDPQPDDVYSTEKYKVVSAPESPAKIYLWNDENDEDVINWWTEATTIRLHHQYANDMFNGLSKLENIDLSGVDTSTATSFANFFNSTAIKTIDLSDWDTSSLTNMANMFSGCGHLATVTFGSDFDTSKVTNMSGLFDGATNLQSVDTENFDTEKVRNMAFMFRSSGIGILDLSSFHTPALTNVQLMFSGATNLTTIYTSADFDLSHVTGTDYHGLAYDYNMFINTDSLAGGAGTAFSFSNPRNKTYARIDDPDNDKPGYFTKKNARYVRFNANGGESEGTVSSHYMSTATAEELPSSGFALEGYRLAGWNTAAGGNGTSYSLGAYMTAPAGNTPLVLYAQWELRLPTITYDANGGTGSMETQSSYGGTAVQLKAPEFRREGYVFIGWNTKTDGTGTNYGANEYITMPNSDMTLYAKWIAPEQGVTMQSFNKSNYESLPTNSIMALRDERDNEIYPIAKMADGNWWMINNLRLDLSNPSVQITTSNTNNPTTSFMNAANNHPANSVESTDRWWCGSNAACTDSITYLNPNRREVDGVYYNTYTATAGRLSTSTPNGYNDAQGDLCPSGWRLPLGSTFEDQARGEFVKLNAALGGSLEDKNLTNNNAMNRFYGYPFNFVKSGSDPTNDSSARDYDLGGTLRTASTYPGSDTTYLLQSTRYNIYVVVVSNASGYPMRCIAK